MNTSTRMSGMQDEPGSVSRGADAGGRSLMGVGNAGVDSGVESNFPFPDGTCGCVPCDLPANGPELAFPAIERFGVDGEYGLHLATTPEQRLVCWNLVYEEYLAKGYVKPQSLALRYSLHDALPDTGSFLIEKQGEPVGTISVFPDSPLGLPADEIYQGEIDRLREAGRIPAEIGRLTIVPKYGKDRKVLMKMVEIPCLFARHYLKATDVVITVNPAHESFYGRMMLFETLGGEQTFGSVCGAPAVLMRMNLGYQEALIQGARGEGPRPDGVDVRHTVYRSFGGAREARQAAERIRMAHRPLTQDFLRQYFVQERPLLPALRSPLKYFLSKCYPGCEMPATEMPATEVSAA